VPSALAAAPEPLHLEVFTGNEDSWGVTSTLIYGKTEAILVDSQFRISQAKKLTDRVAATGRRLKAMSRKFPGLRQPKFLTYAAKAAFPKRRS
jgi:hypothetical protein